MIQTISRGIECEIEVRNARKRTPKYKVNHDSLSESHGGRDDDSIGGHGKENMCRIPGHNHAWRDCRDNRWSQNYQGPSSGSRTIFHAKIPDDETGPTVLRPLRRQPSGRPLRSVPECASEASGRCGGSKRPKEAQPLLTQSIGAPRGILTGNDPKRFEKVRTSSENRPDSYLERKRRVSTRARMLKRGPRRRPFELQTLRFRRERVGPKRGPPKYYRTGR